MFPPGKSGGLIEAMLITCTGFSNPYRFPPGKSGGLIEAISCAEGRRVPHRVSAG